MYIPSAFAQEDPNILNAFLRRYSFATLVTQSSGSLMGSRVPLNVVGEVGTDRSNPGIVLEGHVARANPQWRGIQGEALVIFDGPHAYVSPTWYEEAGTVPTWNYTSIHAYGPIQLVDDRAGLLDILTRSVAVYESGQPTPWTFDPSAAFIEGLLKAIVGFRIEVSRLDAKWKLSQNHSQNRRDRVVAALAAQDDPDAKRVAQFMQNL
ncbi:MAG: FMN-binding negative transcriptional regulator [Isosphaeraceae bacterium]